MAADATPEKTAFKDWFNTERYTAIADSLAVAEPGFDRTRFLHLTLDDLASRELMDRVRQAAIAAQAALPGTFTEQVAALLRTGPESEHGFVGIWYAEFVGRFGLDEPDVSLPALREFTRRGSAEFAIRGFLLRDPDATLAVMRQWACDRNEHVRRLASEGSRPRLPWGKRLDFLIADPRSTRAILDALCADPSAYVRKSVANHLNDIAKDHPDYVLDLVATWDRTNPDTAGIVRHGLRTLIKQGHPRALEWMGASAAPQLEAVPLAVSPQRIHLGDTVTFTATLQSTATATQNLIIDYVVHYVKANGRPSPKVFKWRQLTLAAGETVELRKTQQIRDFTTRRHHAGLHRVEVQINGRRMAESAFNLLL